MSFEPIRKGPLSEVSAVAPAREDPDEPSPTDKLPGDAASVEKSTWQQILKRIWERAKNGRTTGQSSSLQLKTQDRTRAAVALAASVVVAVILFIGLASSGRGPVTRTQPNLGRPPQQAAVGTQGSIAPLINATPEAEEQDNDLHADDIANTARKRNMPQVPPAQASAQSQTLGQIPFDPAISPEYQPPTPRGAEVTPPPPPPVAPRLGPSVDREMLREREALKKPSLVFVRQSTGVSANATAPRISQPLPSPGDSAFLADGTKLIMRLQSAVSSIVKTPVIAVVEYHHEQDGEIVVPAGTRGVGEFQQSTSSGLVHLKFNMLELPDGRRIRLEGTAVGLDNGPLKGIVTGSNRGRRALARALTGIGSTAAYIIGGGGYRLGGSIDNSILLRDRLAQNVGMAGEQELIAISYGQNIAVTVPANMRFYLIVQKAAAEPVGTHDSGAAPIGPPPIPTAAELRQLVELKHELMNLYNRVPLPKTQAEAQPDR